MTVTYPKGFRATGVAAGLKDSGRPDLALIVNDGTNPIRFCSVSVTPKATTTTLETVLNAAVAGTTPAGCVTNYTGSPAITQISSFPASPEERWYLSIDGGAEAKATRSATIHVGDTIYLHFK